jgi:hypothetical protein
MQVLTCIIIVFTIVYFGIKIINKKYDLKHWAHFKFIQPFYQPANWLIFFIFKLCTFN